MKDEHTVTKVKSYHFIVWCSKEKMETHWNYAPKKCPTCGKKIKVMKLKVRM